MSAKVPTTHTLVEEKGGQLAEWGGGALVGSCIMAYICGRFDSHDAPPFADVFDMFPPYPQAHRIQD